ncbi:MAG: diguanylate phosphodiesterase [Oceanospirillaceae bacterium]|nr:diguanylate phosphodiesterase [Oceanospirillaceae bacterium]MBT12679.1 diguanylate phosphodiesterase [Oceanospirillaceae bacterium]|tara:strand:+ start:67395 stop:69617 length:2223 start_codon:yes stop_codon:yes gene_type:complete
MSDEAFHFAEEKSSALPAEAGCWKVLTVEDDATYQASLLHNLRGLVIEDNPVEVLCASSAAMAGGILAEHTDIALALVDVVMEEDDAGLTLVRTIREVLGNDSIRVILLTGQPGMAPRKDVMLRYDIDEYWNKSDLTREKLHAVLRSNLRTWQYMEKLNQAKKGLQVIIDASRNLYSKHDLQAFSQSVLDDINRIIDNDGGGIVCSCMNTVRTDSDFTVIAANGDYQSLNGLPLTTEQLDKYSSTLALAKNSHEHQFRHDFSVLFFETSNIDGYQYLVIIDSPVKPTEQQIYLLQVFSENIRTGFANVALINRVTKVAYFDDTLNIYNRSGLLREIGSMSEQERNHSVLLLVAIRRYSDMMIAFGESYCRSLLLSFMEDITEMLPEPTSLAMVNTGVFGIVIEASKVPDAGVLEMASERTLSLSGIEHHLLLSFCRTDLALMSRLPASEVIELAEATLLHADENKQAYCEYKSVYKDQITGRTLLLQKVQKAILNRGLSLLLQPKVDMKSGRAVGFEALVRLHDDDGNMIAPLEFIPLAEASGLITLIDQQVLGMTLEAIQTLKSFGYQLPVSFNASAVDLYNRNYSKAIFSVIANKLVSPELLDIEITESEMIADYDKFDVLLKQFVELGMGVSIDDFGTGYSSLSRITGLSATTLKIDKSFVQGLEHSASDHHVVEMICRIGERFGYKIVAEGVETEAQRRILTEAGCYIAQGYLFARPMPLDSIIDWLRNNDGAGES